MKEYLTASKISYFSIGTGTPIIFLHGLELDKSSTSLFFEPFLNIGGYQRIYFDLPGMGNSNPIYPATSDHVLELILHTIEKLIGNRPFIIYGHSFGGYLAQAVTKKLPKQVLGMFLTCPVVTADSSNRIIGKHINIFQEKIIPTENKDYFDDFLKINVIINQQCWQDYKKLIIPGLKKANTSFIKQLQGKSYQLSFESSLKTTIYPCPLKIMIGKNDQDVGYQEQLQLIQNNDNDEVVLLNQTGHNLMIDHPEIVKCHFKLFLAELTITKTQSLR